MVDVKLLSKEDKKLVLLISKTDPSFVNTLRRIIIVEVPTLAVEDVRIVNNSSALNDEMVAHRLGLIPLKTDLKSYNLMEECKCKNKGCSMCVLKFKLKAKGPCTVYSSELKTADPKVVPVYDNIPILKLLEGQEIALDGNIILGKGKTHTKFSPGLAYYKGKISILGSNKKDMEKVAKLIPILDIKGNKLEVKDEVKWKDSYSEICSENNLEVSFSDTEFIFFMESWGQLSVKDILFNAMECFDKKLVDFQNLVKKIK